jgi:NAD(P)-dependent dehydrogenase (short-subunit alcohol dehydrogenase family)
VSAAHLSGKIALITGAAGGIGAEIARKFQAEGASVFVADTNQVEGEKTAASIGATFVLLDVTSEESWLAALANVLERSGRLDILVNNAGINIRKNIEEMDVASFDAMIAVNVRGPFVGIKHALPIMRTGGGGVILNMSSICGLVGHKFTNETYTTTKGALTMLTKSVAVRYAKDNIRCNSVHASTVETALVQNMLKDPERRAERLGEIPLGRLASTADVANAFVYLASDEAAFINGVALAIDGGLTAY